MKKKSVFSLISVLFFVSLSLPSIMAESFLTSTQVNFVTSDVVKSSSFNWNSVIIVVAALLLIIGGILLVKRKNRTKKSKKKKQ